MHVCGEGPFNCNMASAADRLRDVRYLHTCGERLGLTDEVCSPAHHLHAHRTFTDPRSQYIHCIQLTQLANLDADMALSSTDWPLTHALLQPNPLVSHFRWSSRPCGATTVFTGRLSLERSIQHFSASLSCTLLPSAPTLRGISVTASPWGCQWPTRLSHPPYPSMSGECHTTSASTSVCRSIRSCAACTVLAVHIQMHMNAPHTCTHYSLIH